MTTTAPNKELFNKLKAPFPSSDVEWRIGTVNKDKTRGRALPYLTFKAVADRLDDVVGEENWKDEYVAGPAGGVVCKLSLRINGEWICKENGAGNTDLEGVKGGLTDAFKRAATMWGVGRYLHAYEAIWVEIGENNTFQAPALPDALVPESEVEERRQAGVAAAAEEAAKAADPDSGKAAAEKAAAEKAAAEKAAAEKAATEKAAAEKAAAEKAATEKAATEKAAAEKAATEKAATEKAATEKAPAEKAAEKATAKTGAEEQATTTAETGSTSIAIGEDGLPVMPTDLPEAQVKRINQLIERMEKGIQISVIRDYVNGPQGTGSMQEIARQYVLARLDHHEKNAAVAA